ncbi:GGDEF domain-containing protein [Pleionea sediminis]|uniref:GGDEF domain-containing protein n=1 Tax=Pleionea sediminis TaxID=2569479 RepID=UPI0011856004|nr:GGDEF domain-containing protein [Pleionea sediminis]
MSSKNGKELFSELFDEMPFNVYVSDVKTFELVFVNKQLRTTMTNGTTGKCYKRVYQFEEPCPHCPIKANPDIPIEPDQETIVSEYFNELDDRWYQLQDKYIVWTDGRIVKYSIGVDITEQKKTQNQLAEAHAQLALRSKHLEVKSITDPLTGLFNRYKLKEILEREVSRCMRSGAKLSVILVDLDHFKSINDTFGHIVGDKVLQQTAEVLKRSLRSYDHLARWGGEEFVVVCPESPLLAAKQVAEKLRTQLLDTEFPQLNRVTASFGIAEYISEESIDDLISRADKGLYCAKETGRNRVVAME